MSRSAWSAFAESPWRRAPRYRAEVGEERAVLDALARHLAGLDHLDTPVWAFDAERCQCLWANRSGLQVWRAPTVEALWARDVASTQSEAVYAMLNDFLRRVVAGEAVGCWVTLDPQGTTRRFYQTHHPLRLADGRDVLLIEAQGEPPAEEVLAFAANHTLTIGLYELDGALVSGNPAFVALSEGHPLDHLDTLLPPGHPQADWRERIGEQSVIVFEHELRTARGVRAHRCELRQVRSHDRRPRVMLSLYDIQEERLARAERAHHEAIAKSLREKETLLKEIHHRVKNNLQVISSLLHLQAGDAAHDETRDLLRESAHRVTSMALIHQQFYGGESLERIEFGAYAERLGDSLRAVFAPTARLRVVAVPVEVAIHEAVPLGLVLNELLSNAFKHGAPPPGTVGSERRPGPGCDLLVEVGAGPGTLWMAVTDGGPGLTEGEESRTGSLGMHIVRVLLRQLRATMTVSSDRGTRVEVVCPHP